MKKLLLVLALLFSTPIYAAKVYVLCYHTFYNKADISYINFSHAEAKQHIHTMREAGMNFITHDDLVSDRVNGDRNVLVTIDDGNRSTVDAVKKIFAPAGIRPLLAIYYYDVGKKHQVMTWDDMRDLRLYADFASHGYYHSDVRRLNEKKMDVEIGYSRLLLQRAIGVNITTFIFPYGAWSNNAIPSLKKYGYHNAYILGSKPVYTGNGTKGNYMLTRYMLTRKNQWCIIKKIVRLRTNR